jgi:hypothetical protein
VTPGSARPRWLAALAAAALVTAGCGSAGEERAPDAAYTVEQLAAAVGCPAKPQGTATDVRQASCTVDGANVVFLQFDTESGQRHWLDYATLYGGVYLVGDRWVVTGGAEDYLRDLREKLGGEIRKADG